MSLCKFCSNKYCEFKKSYEFEKEPVVVCSDFIEITQCNSCIKFKSCSKTYAGAEPGNCEYYTPRKGEVVG